MPIFIGLMKQFLQKHQIKNFEAEPIAISNLQEAIISRKFNAKPTLRTIRIPNNNMFFWKFQSPGSFATAKTMTQSDMLEE